MAPEPAAKPAAPKQPAFVMPISIVEPADVYRLRREIAEVDEFMRQATIRKPGNGIALPRTSHALSDITELNKLNLLRTADRQWIAAFLSSLQNQAPVLHISFASDPSQAFIVKIVHWLRENIHPEVLVQIGLQPSIAAGCIVRTTNKQFDFSLREKLLSHRELLMKAFEAKAVT